MPWYAIYTRPRHEKQVNDRLEERAFETYLPLVKRVSQWKDRKRTIEEPLFKSYLFVNFEYKYRFDVLETNGVLNIVNFNRRPAVVPEWQITSLRRMLEAPETLKLEPYLRPGELVEVSEGPMKGMRGTVIRRKGTHRLVLSIDGIMQSVSVEIAEIELKKIKESGKR
jgi:transcription antitermination factor NusG